MSDVRRLAELGMVPPLAKELVAQIASGVGNARRLSELSAVPALASELVRQLSTRAGSSRRLTELGVTLPLAAEIASLISNAVPPAAASLLSRPAMSTVSPTRRNQIIQSFIGAGSVIDKLDFWHMLNGENETQAAQNWIADAFNLVKSGAPAFTAGRGYKGDGSAAFLSSGFVPSTANGKMTLNSATISVMALEPQLVAPFGVELGSNTAYVGSITGPNEFRMALNASGRITGTGLTNAYAVGLLTLVRRDGSNVDVYVGRAKLGTYALASSALSNVVLYYLRSASGLYSNRSISVGFAGAALTDAEVAAMADAIHADMGATGAYLKDASVFCFGNSRTFGIDTVDPVTQSYPAQMQALYGSASVEVIRQGFPGQSAIDINGYLDTNISVRTGLQYPAKRRVLVYWEIGNSLAAGRTATQAIDDIEAGIAKARAIFKPEKVIVCTDPTAVSNTVGRQQASALLRSRAPSFADGIADLEVIPTLQNFNDTTYFSADKIHFTTAGYTQIAPVVKAAVDAVLST